MPHIQQLSESSINNTELLTNIRNEAKDLIDHLMAPESYMMALELEQRMIQLVNMETSQPKIFGVLTQILIRLKFVSLHLWDNETYEDLITNHLPDILGSEIDVNDCMTAKVYMIPVLAWPEIAQSTIEATQRSSRILGNQYLVIR